MHAASTRQPLHPRAGLPLRLLHSSPELTLGALGNVHLSVYRTTPTVDLLRLDQRFHEELAARSGNTVVFTVTPFGVSLPDAPARALASDLVRRNSAFVKASAVLTEGDGFWGSAARSAVTAVFMLARQPYPSRVFGDALEAATWLGGYTGESAVAMRDALTEIRRG